METSNICPKCQQIIEYTKDNRCKFCQRKRAKLYREKNKEKIKAYKNLHRQTEQAKKLHTAHSMRYARDNKEKIAAYQKDYRIKNREKLKEYKKSKLKERCSQIKKRRKNDHHFRVSSNMKCALYRTLKDRSLNKSRMHWEDLVGYTKEQLIQHLESLFTSEMSWENYGAYWHIDHIKPQSLFSYTSMTDDEFKECWSLSNLQPLEAKENIRKSNKWNS